MDGSSEAGVCHSCDIHLHRVRVPAELLLALSAQEIQQEAIPVAVQQLFSHHDFGQREPTIKGVEPGGQW